MQYHTRERNITLVNTSAIMRDQKTCQKVGMAPVLITSLQPIIGWLKTACHAANFFNSV